MSQYTTSAGLAFSSEFRDGQWVAVEPMASLYGEGDTDEQAAMDLLNSLYYLRRALRGQRLAPALEEQLAFLEQVLPA